MPYLKVPKIEMQRKISEFNKKVKVIRGIRAKEAEKRYN